MKRTVALLALSLSLAACTTMPSDVMGRVQPGLTTDTQISQQLGARPVAVRYLNDGSRHEVWAKRNMPNPFSMVDEAFAGDFSADGVLIRVTGASIQQAAK